MMGMSVGQYMAAVWGFTLRGGGCILFSFLATSAVFCQAEKRLVLVELQIKWPYITLSSSCKCRVCVGWLGYWKIDINEKLM